MQIELQSTNGRLLELDVEYNIIPIVHDNGYCVIGWDTEINSVKYKGRDFISWLNYDYIKETVEELLKSEKLRYM